MDIPQISASWLASQAARLNATSKASLERRIARKKHRANWLTVPQQFNLNVACRPLQVFGYGTYLVGSCLTKPDYHDVDLRCILADDEYDRMFAGDGGERKLKFLNVAVSQWIKMRTGLPIDFQFQRATEANAAFNGPRHAVGLSP